jgi:hypothetical protein
MFRKVTLLVLMLSGCGFTLDVDIEGIEKIDALLDGGISIHIDGIPDGGYTYARFARSITERY